MNACSPEPRLLQRARATLWKKKEIMHKTGMTMAADQSQRDARVGLPYLERGFWRWTGPGKAFLQP